MKNLLPRASGAAVAMLLIPAFLASSPAVAAVIETDVLTLSLTFGLTSPFGDEIITVSGPATIIVNFEDSPAGSLEGNANDDSGNGLEEVSTEIVSMELTGTSTLGGVFMFLSPVNPSAGVMEEVGNATPGVLDVPPFAAAGAADAFFDVFFEMEIGGGLFFRNLSSLVIGGSITHKPPLGNELGNILTTDPVELFTPNNEPTAFVLRQPAAAIAEPGSLAILGLGLLGLGAMRRRGGSA